VIEKCHVVTFPVTTFVYINKDYRFLKRVERDFRTVSEIKLSGLLQTMLSEFDI